MSDLTKAQAHRRRKIRAILRLYEERGLASDVVEDALWKLYPGFHPYKALAALFEEATATLMPVPPPSPGELVPLYRIPTTIPAAWVMVHNGVRPTRRLGSRGFRAWLQAPSDQLKVCSCGWASEVGDHYRGLPQQTEAS
jgi:hypothetical protein